MNYWKIQIYFLQKISLKENSKNIFKLVIYSKRLTCSCTASTSLFLILRRSFNWFFVVFSKPTELINKQKWSQMVAMYKQQQTKYDVTKTMVTAYEKAMLNWTNHNKYHFQIVFTVNGMAMWNGKKNVEVSKFPTATA